MAGMEAFGKNRWTVFVGAMWVQSCAGVGYMFGSMSPVIKSMLGYNQREIAVLGVAKAAGDFLGFCVGSLCSVVPYWAALLIGATKNLVGYGCLWLIVSGKLPALPLWGMCILIFVGTNGETYYNTTSLVSCLQSFPKNRGPVVGILKGFAGLSGAILIQIYAMMHSRDQSSIIFMIAVGPSLVVITLMFIVRPVGGHRRAQSSDNASFMFINFWCLFLAVYLMGVMLLRDLVNLSKAISDLFTIVLLVLLIAPIVIPLLFTFYFDVKSPTQECLLPTTGKPRPSPNDYVTICSGVEDEIPEEVDSLSLSAEVQTKLIIAESVGGVTVKRRRGPCRGEDFTLMQALRKADFWLLFISLLLGTGTGLTVIDNLGQLSQ